MASDSPLSEAAPDWLPSGWRMEFRVRSSGATSGQRDRYYYDPVSNRRFRSKKEVLTFLDSGVSPQQKKNTNSGIETTPGSSKRKKIAPKVSIENFKFAEPPEKVKWVLTDVREGLWSPMTPGGATKVTEAVRLEWKAAYRHLSSLPKDEDSAAS